MMETDGQGRCAAYIYPLERMKDERGITVKLNTTETEKSRERLTKTEAYHPPSKVGKHFDATKKVRGREHQQENNDTIEDKNTGSPDPDPGCFLPWSKHKSCP